MLSREAGIAQRVVLVDGIARSGKAVIAPILSSFKNMEILRVEETLDLTGWIYAMGKIPRDAAVALLRMKTDINLYNGMIGRDTNFRFSDYSSVWKNSNPWRFVRRLRAKEGEPILQAARQYNPIYQQTTHDQLGNIHLFIDAFGSQFRNVQMIRHPVDLVDSWMRRDLGNRFGVDPLAFTICFRHQGHDLPLYASGWEDAYLSASPAGRCVRMIEWVWDRNQRAYLSLNESQRKQVFFIPFEDFVERPLVHIVPLAQFLGSATTGRTNSALKRQKCPRTLHRDVMKKEQSIESQVSTEEMAIMKRLVDEYESLVLECAR
jgi:hypothetical protein